MRATRGNSDTWATRGNSDTWTIRKYSGLEEKEEEEEEEEEETTPVLCHVVQKEDESEGYLGWVVVFVSFICIAVLDGVGYTTGLLLSSLLRDLGGSRAQVSFAGSLQVGIYSLTGPIVGRLVTEWGTRYVCIAGAIISSLGMLAASYGSSLGSVMVGYSVITGVGFGLMYIPSVVGAAPFFKKRRSLAIGICLCGSGVGTFAMAPICEAILTNYGWRWVFRCFSALCLGCVICGMCMFSKSPEQLKEEEEEEENPPPTQLQDNTCNEEVEKLRAPYRVVDPSLFNNPNFVTFLLVILADFLAFTGVYIPYTHLPPLAMARNISSSDAAILISAGGISNTVGRFLGGWLCDQPYFHPFMVTIASVALTIIPCIAIPRLHTLGGFLSFFSSFGLTTGCMVGATSPLLLRLLGLKALSQTFGLLTASRGVAALLGPPFAGLLVDWWDEPGIAMDLCGLLQIAGLIVYSLAIIKNSIVTRRRSYIPL